MASLVSIYDRIKLSEPFANENDMTPITIIKELNQYSV